ncbi:MAG: hypothetical protein ABW026_18575 [Microvirga sp.]
MRADAPVSIAMDALSGGGGFYLHVLGARGRRLMRLGPFPEEDVLAEWQRLCATTGLSMTIRLPNGSFLALYDQIGPIRCGGAPIPARRLVLNGRRPRFLTRRKTGLACRVETGSRLAASEDAPA